MKKLLYFSFLTTVILSCHKNSPSINYFQFQLNGVSYTFDSVVAQVDTSGGAYIASIHAANTKTGSRVSVLTQSNFKSLNGTYSHISPPPSDHILINFLVNVVDRQLYYNYTIEGSPFTFVINNSSNNKIQGAFSGSLTFLNTGSDGNVTNGKFNITYTFQ